MDYLANFLVAIMLSMIFFHALAAIMQLQKMPARALRRRHSVRRWRDQLKVQG